MCIPRKVTLKLRKWSGVLLAVALFFGVAAVGSLSSPSPASAQSGYRLCYFSDEGLEESYIFKRSIKSSFKTWFTGALDCDQLSLKLTWNGEQPNGINPDLEELKNVPTLTRMGQKLDFSICEYYTAWKFNVALDDKEDICMEMDTEVLYTLKELSEKANLSSRPAMCQSSIEETEDCSLDSTYSYEDDFKEAAEDFSG